MDEMEMEMREVTGMAAKLWWIWLVLGIIWIIVSLVVLQFNSASITTVGVIIGILFLIVGLQSFLVAWLSEGWKWLWVIFGVLFIIAGIVALVYPKNTTAALADVLGFMFLLVGIYWVVEALTTRDLNELWWIGLVAGILMIIIAFWTAGQFYGVKLYTLLVFGGIWLLLQGVTDIIKAFMIRKVGKIAAT